MKEISKKRYCDRCRKETNHHVREDALEIEYTCDECNKQEDIVKTFF
jgi:ribosomal protein L44E